MIHQRSPPMVLIGSVAAACPKHLDSMPVVFFVSIRMQACDLS